MLDVRALAYVTPLAEQPLDDLTPVIHVHNYADEDAVITGLFRIYRKTTDQLLYTSEMVTTTLLHGASADIAALTPWSPGAPADDDYFILADCVATSYLPGPPHRFALGAYTFDIKPGPMGPAPAAHHATHEAGGMDPVEVENLPTLETDPTLVLAPDGAGGVEFRAEAGGGGPGVMFDPQVLTDGANIAWDLSLGGQATVTLGGNRTLDEATNMVDGAHYSLRIIQDGTGTRLISWHATYRFPAGVDPCLSAAPNNIDILLFLCDGTNLDCVGMVSAVA